MINVAELLNEMKPTIMGWIAAGGSGGTSTINLSQITAPANLPANLAYLNVEQSFTAPQNIQFSKTDADGASRAAFYTAYYVDPSADDLAGIDIGVWANVLIAPGNTKNFAGIRGVQGGANHYGSGTVWAAIGVTAQVQNRSTGVISLGFGLYVDTPLNVGGGSITQTAGIEVLNQGLAGSAFSFGAVLLETTGAAKNINLYLGSGTPAGDYSIYNGSTKANYFAGALTIDNALTVKQIATPAAPATNYSSLYPKSDGLWYSRPAGGAEVVLATGSAGINPTPVRGSIIVANATPTFVAVGVGAAGYHVRSDGTDTAFSNIGIPAYIRKTTTETVNNSAVRQADDVLVWPMAANEVWEIEWCLRVATSAAAGFQFAIDVPTLAVFMGGGTMAEQNAAAGASGVTDAGQIVTKAFNTTWVVVKAYIINGTNAGSAILQWAQSAATAINTQVVAGSWLKATRVA